MGLLQIYCPSGGFKKKVSRAFDKLRSLDLPVAGHKKFKDHWQRSEITLKLTSNHLLGAWTAGNLKNRNCHHPQMIHLIRIVNFLLNSS